MSTDVPPAKPSGQRGSRFWSGLLTAIALALAVVWAWSGVSKVLDQDAFQSIVEIHGVLPGAAQPAVWLLGPLELALACCLGIFGGRAGRFGFVIVALSALLVGVFSIYLLFVPEATLEATGCGCRTGLNSLTSGLDTNTRLISLGINTALGVLHVPLLLVARKPQR